MNLSTLKLDELPVLGSGSECTVYDLGDETCYKHYNQRNNDNIETVYYNAKMAHNFGIAPEVYECGERGYRTEIVDTFRETCKKADCGGSCCGNICDYLLDIIGYKEYEEFLIEVRELFGICATGDLHYNNIGIKNGKLIMIDFGEYSELSEE